MKLIEAAERWADSEDIREVVADVFGKDVADRAQWVRVIDDDPGGDTILLEVGGRVSVSNLRLVL